MPREKLPESHVSEVRRRAAMKSNTPWRKGPFCSTEKAKESYKKIKQGLDESGT